MIPTSGLLTPIETEILGMKGRLGVVASGALADPLVTDSSPLQ